MVINIFVKCNVCNTTYKLRWQVGRELVPVSFNCLECNTNIDGKLSIIVKGNSLINNPFKCHVNLENASKILENDSLIADYIFEVSTEFFCKKIDKNNFDIGMSPFLRNFNLFIDDDYINDLFAYIEKLKNYNNKLNIIFNLYNKKKYEYLTKELLSKENFWINENSMVLKKEKFQNEVDYLMGVHHYSFALLHKTLIEKNLADFNKIMIDINELYKYNSFNVLELTKVLYEKKIIENLNNKFSILCDKYLKMMVNLTPLYVVKCDLSSIDLETYGITTINLGSLLNLYNKIYEFLGEYIIIIIGLNNISERGNINKFNNKEEDFYNCILKVNSKFNLFNDYLISGEKFTSLFDGVIDNIIRNSEAHFDTTFDSKTQLITFTSKKGDKSKITKKYLAEFACLVINSFQKCVFVWEFYYQCYKLFLIYFKSQKPSFIDEI